MAAWCPPPQTIRVHPRPRRRILRRRSRSPARPSKRLAAPDPEDGELVRSGRGLRPFSQPPFRDRLPSMVPEDDEPEDTLMRVLRPLKDAERGIPTSTNPPPTSTPPASLPAGFVGVEGDEHRSGELGGRGTRLRGAGRARGLPRPGRGRGDRDRRDRDRRPHEPGRAERLTGWTEDEARGRPGERRLRPRRAATRRGPEATLAQELGAAPPDHTALLQRRDGQLLPVRHVHGRGGGRGSATSTPPPRAATRASSSSSAT